MMVLGRCVVASLLLASGQVLAQSHDKMMSNNNQDSQNFVEVEAQPGDLERGSMAMGLTTTRIKRGTGKISLPSFSKWM